MIPLARLTAALPLLLLLAACASSRVQTEPEVGQFIPRSGTDVLTASEVAGFTDALQAVQRLRPRWLRSHLSGRVWIFRDGIRIGGIDALSVMPTAGIVSFRYYDHQLAPDRWGVGVQDVVIAITSRR